MWKPIAAALLTVVACPVTFTSLKAGVFCGQPPGLCACSPCLTCQPAPCGCSAPVQAVPPVRYRDVTRTEYRMQPETRQVPVTRYRSVTVDQGAWHKIWVPRIVTRQVPETVYENRTSYRQVPYQVTQRVPDTSFQGYHAPMPSLSGRSSSPDCHNCTPSTTWSSQPVAAAQPAVPRSAAVDPAHSDLRPLRRISRAPASLTPEPEPPRVTSSAGAWTPVKARDSHTGAAPQRAGSAAGHFIPAPRTASVLRARSPRLR